LEFDHVYVAGTGRPVDLTPVLRTKLFSGEAPAYKVDLGTGVVASTDKGVLSLAMADREREVYVALTRAKQTLTLLFDPDHEREFLTLNPVIEKLFQGAPGAAYPKFPKVQLLKYKP
jgi:DNA helicase-2/ATP-dependent DNA helicase PcrA